MPIKVNISVSTKPKKKYTAIFYEEDGTKIKTTHFGQKSADDYTKTNNDDRKKLYLARHKKRENWDDYKSAGALSRWILWNKKTLHDSKLDFVKRFNLKLIK